MQIMKKINNYAEFRHNDGESVRDHISSEPIENKENILKYLKSWPNEGIRCATLCDYITDEILKPSVWTHTDGTYRWSDEETYHFEKYNMELNEDFVKWVLERIA